ncbi:MAG: invasion associated locus family protein, partial [Devosia sp.]|uniref:invasion associated locus B family protein n=1 Tax=Devosia sp. TaxID=1871048 RepID=UPI002A7387EC|nr:invasion associated locus family protein [Devosia sp.]
FVALMSGSAALQGVWGQAPSATLPGGATSLREAFDDWQVTCTAQGATKRCALSQEQVDQNRQRVLAIELIPAENNTLTGTLVMPFGLVLDSGITVQLDDKPLGKPLRFRTCLPAGCILPLQLDAATTNALRAGTSLKLSGLPNDGNKPITFSISLKGFPGALSRTAALLK